MRVAALVLGIIGGVIGIMAAATATGLGGMAGALADDPAATAQATDIAGRGALGIVISIVALVGGALAMAKPRTAAVIMLLTGIAGLVAVGGFYLLAGPLLLVGALLAFLGRKSATAAVTPATT